MVSESGSGGRRRRRREARAKAGEGAWRLAKGAAGAAGSSGSSGEGLGKAGVTPVGPGALVGLRYRLYDAEGELLEDSPPDEPLTYVHGYGQLLPALEAAIAGMVAGEKRAIWLDEHDAFGPHDPEAVFEVGRDEFPEPDKVRVGAEFAAEGEGGGFSLRVIDVLPDGFVVDANHPLAGQRLQVRASIEHVRPASAEEIEEAERALEALQAEGEGPADRPESPGPAGGLLSAESLLRRGRGGA